MNKNHLIQTEKRSRRLSTEQFTPSYMCIREEDWEEVSDDSDSGKNTSYQVRIRSDLNHFVHCTVIQNLLKSGR